MKALLLEENAKLLFKEVPDPIQKNGWYKIKVMYAGICGSDIQRGFEKKAYCYPLIMGHEFSGIIDSVPQKGIYPPGLKVAVFPCFPAMSAGPALLESTRNV